MLFPSVLNSLRKVLLFSLFCATLPCNFLHSQENEQDLPWPTNRKEALAIVKAAKTQKKLPAQWKNFSSLNQKLTGQFVFTLDEDPFTDPLRVSVKVAGSDYLVLSYENEEGISSSDIYAIDSKKGTMRRWSVLPWNEFATLEGDFLKKEPAILFKKSLWTGTLKKNDRPTASLTVAEVILSSSPKEDDPTGYLSSIVLSRETLQLNNHGDSLSSRMSLSSNLEKPLERKKPNPLLGTMQKLFSSRKDKPEDKVPPPPEQYLFEDRNFSFLHPDFGSFRKVDPSIIGPDTTLALLERKNNVTSLVQIVAESTDPALGMSQERLTKIAKAFFENLNADGTFTDFEPFEVNGNTFDVFAAHASLHGRPSTWMYGLCAHNGFLYQVILLRPGQKVEKNHQELLSLLKGFSLIDRERIAAGDGSQVAQVFQNQPLGVRIDPQPLKVLAWDPADRQTLYPASDFGYLETNRVGALLLTFDLGSLVATDEDLKAILLEAVGMDADKEMMIAEEWSQGTAKGQRFQQADPEFLMEARILRNGETATVLFAFAPIDQDGSSKALSRLLNPVEFTTPVPRDQRPDLQDKIYSNKTIIFNDLGYLLLTQGDLTGAIPFFQQALTLEPDSAIIATNLLDTYLSLGRNEDVLKWLDDEGSNLNKLPQFLTYRAKSLRNLGRLDECQLAMAQIFEQDQRHDDSLLEYISLLLELGDPDSAVELVDDYIAKHKISTLQVLRWQYQTYREAGLAKKELAAVSVLAEKHPKNSSIALDLVIALNNDEQFEQAIEQVKTAKKLSKTDNPTLDYQEGLAHLGKKDYQKAKESFEAAQLHSPDEPLFQEGLQMASALLGQGDNSDLKTPIAPVETPEKLKSFLTQNQFTEEETGFHSIVLEEVTGMFFQPKSNLRRSESSTIKVLTRSGVEDYKTIRFSFDPLIERAHLNFLRVYDESGNQVAESKTEDCYASERNESNGMATRDKVVSVPVPGLKPGFTIRYQYTLEDKSESEEFPFKRVLAASFRPAGPTAVFVTGSPKLVKSLSRNGEFIHQCTDEMSYWVHTRPPRLINESMLPRYDQFLPLLILGTTKGDWTSVSQDYLELISDRLVPDEKTTALAQELTAGLTLPSEKVKAILSHVQNSLAYQAIEFGPRGQIPNPCPAILSSRYGDCKDHSLLAKQLLEAVEIPAHLALVDSTFSFQSEVPSLDQFDHMILYLPSKGEGRFVDLTAKFASPTSASVSSLSGRKSLILDGKGTIETIPILTAEDNTCEVISTVTSQESALLKVKESITLHGRQAEWLRGYLSNLPESDYEKTFEGLFSNERGLQIESVVVTQLQDFEKPCKIEISYRVERARSIPHPWPNLYLSGYSPSQRKNPFTINDPLRLRMTTHFISDKKTRVDWKPKKVSTKWLQSQIQATKSESKQTLQAELNLASGEYPSKFFLDYVRNNNEFLDGIAGSFLTLEEAK